MATIANRRLEAQFNAELIDWIRTALGLTYREIGEMVGTTARTAQRWGNPEGVSLPTEKHRARLQALRDLRRLLGSGALGDADAQTWLFTASPALQGRRPIDLIRAGEAPTLVGVLAGLQAGTFS